MDSARFPTGGLSAFAGTIVNSLDAHSDWGSVITFGGVGWKLVDESVVASDDDRYCVNAFGMNRGAAAFKRDCEVGVEIRASDVLRLCVGVTSIATETAAPSSLDSGTVGGV